MQLKLCVTLVMGANKKLTKLELSRRQPMPLPPFRHNDQVHITLVNRAKHLYIKHVQSKFIQINIYMIVWSPKTIYQCMQTNQWVANSV